MMTPEAAYVDNLSQFADIPLDDTSTRPLIGRVATHIYGGVAGYAKAATYGIPLWQTEYNEGGGTNGTPDATIASGITVARMVHDCFATYGYSMFGFFLVAGLPGWTGYRYGLLGDAYADTKRAFTFGNFARFVRPGYRRVACTGAPSDVYASAYKGDHLAIVAINDNATSTAVDFSGLPAIANLTPWLTDASHNLAAQTPVSVSGGTASATLAAKSVTTFVGKMLTIDPPVAPIGGALTLTGSKLIGTTIASVEVT
jgi:glucuronoarabinoxylan endo-1,4-beta-xylanase